MGESIGEFNLLTENWIPVLYCNGDWTRVGIRKALTEAHRIRVIAASNPMDRVAILRFLLAVLYWCQGNPPEGPASPDSFLDESFTRLKENMECFNLLGSGKRFYQDKSAKRIRPVTDLIQEIPAGNNFWHFSHATDKSDGLCPACCSIGLLRLPLFSVSGLSGPGEPNLMAGINGVPPIYVVPWGKTLKETLTANWSSCQTLGEPTWLEPNAALSPGEEVPLLTGLTLLPRRVWLHESDERFGTCIGCGLHQMPLVRTIEFQTAGKQENDKWNDPHVVYVKGAKRRALRAEDLTRSGKFIMDRPWPDLVRRAIDSGRPPSLLVVGFATNKAKYVDVWERTMNLPSTRSVSEAAARLIEQWQREGSRRGFAMRLLKENQNRPLGKRAEITATLAAVRPHVEGRVSAKIDELLAGADETWDNAVDQYRPMMKMLAYSFSPGFTTVAVERRERIRGTLPDMRKKPNPETKKRDKKGEDT